MRLLILEVDIELKYMFCLSVPLNTTLWVQLALKLALTPIFCVKFPFTSNVPAVNLFSWP